MQYFLVLLIVAANVFATLVTRFATDFPLFQYMSVHRENILIVTFLLFLVLLLNIMKFWLWGVSHKRFSLNRSYPIAALFYPIMYVISVFMGEAFWEIPKILGAMLIFGGTLFVNQE